MSERPDPPVAVPGPASVSPADTIRLDEIRERAEYAVSSEMAEMLVDAPEDDHRWARYLGGDILALLAVGERDRQQIALLTEVGKAAQIVAELNGEKRSTYGRPVTNVEWQNALYHLETAVSGARAVLAGEEDAGNG